MNTKFSNYENIYEDVFDELLDELLDEYYIESEKILTPEEIELEKLHSVVEAKPEGLGKLLREYYPELFI